MVSPKAFELEISGMTCDHCVQHVTQALGALRGVRRVDVRLQEGRATVNAQSDVYVEHLIEAVEEAGYQARPVVGEE
jgi:copper ion binding protein